MQLGQQLIQQARQQGQSFPDVNGDGIDDRLQDPNFLAQKTTQVHQQQPGLLGQLLGGGGASGGHASGAGGAAPAGGGTSGGMGGMLGSLLAKGIMGGIAGAGLMRMLGGGGLHYGGGLFGPPHGRLLRRRSHVRWRHGGHGRDVRGRLRRRLGGCLRGRLRGIRPWPGEPEEPANKYFGIHRPNPGS